MLFVLMGKINDLFVYLFMKILIKFIYSLFWNYRPKIFSKYLGETENSIRNLFKRARQITPCIVFIDELDSITSRRGK